MRRIAAVLFTVLLLACRRETPQPQLPPVPATTTESATNDGGRLVRRLEGNPTTLNYLLQQTEDERQVLSLLYDPLIDLDQNLVPIPGVAARWDVLDEGRTYVLHLDPRANFSDGAPVRASDVVFTLNKIFDAQSAQFTAWFEGLDRMRTKAIDERTVRVVFAEAHAGRIYAFNIGVMPEHVYAKENFAKTTKLVGNGPYVLKRRGRDQSLLLERRENYWREKPAVASVLFRPIADNSVAWKALQRGEVDVSRVDNDLWFRMKDDPTVKKNVAFHDVWQLGYNAIVWNLSDPILNDARVRRALAMAFDRQTIIEKLYHGQARAVTGPFTPDLRENNPEALPIEFNPSAGAALLASAGWRDTDADGTLDREGKKFELTLLVIAKSAISRDQAQVFQDALSRIGVKLEIKALDDAAFYDLVVQRNYQAAFLAWVNEPDPDPSDLFHSKQLAPDGMNVTGYANEEADSLMDKANRELDPATRITLYHHLHDVLARDQPYLWTVQVAEKWAVSRRVQNVQVAKGFGLFHWYPDSRAWWLKK
ncbi:MAG TPA: ABC transporter substrate-binding protein [Thermoanaerobaculia bacterium]|jgi:peptide/nickel transport system substrate-binding protein|nr:ABC transporter substrate-binding protein [Thermoanaerobaculia bacterium]